MTKNKNELKATAAYYGLKPIEAAVKLGVSLQTYYNYTSGRTKMPPYVPLALAAKMNGLEPASVDYTNQIAALQLGVSRQVAHRWQRYGTPLSPRLAAALIQMRSEK